MRSDNKEDGANNSVRKYVSMSPSCPQHRIPKVGLARDLFQIGEKVKGC